MENEVTTTSEIFKTSDIKGWIGSVFFATSQTVVGQTLFKIIDSFLWVVEKSAQWSLPAQEVESDDNGKIFGKIKLIRPLPWFLFLPGLVILRIIRCTINVGAYVFGYSTIEPSGMVKFVQRSRRRLRTLNLKIAKSMRRGPTNKDKRLTMIEAKKALIRSIRLTLSTLSCLDTSKSSPSPPPTKIRISHADLEPVTTPDEKSTTESVDSPIQHEAKRKFSQLSSDEKDTDESDNEALNLKLERLAMEDSADDLDFNFPTCSTGIDTPCSSVSSDEADKDVSLTELRDIQKEAKEFLQKVISPSTKTVTQSLEKLEDTPDGEKCGVDSSESQLQKVTRSSQTFIVHEISSMSEQLPTDTILSPGETNAVFIENQKEPATCELPSAQDSCKLSPKEEFCELPSAQDSCKLSPIEVFCELPPAQESCKLSPTEESCELPSAQDSCKLSPTEEFYELPPAQESCKLPPAQESCELPSAQDSCKLSPTEEFYELPPAQQSCELPSAQQSCELQPAPKFRELSSAPKFRESPPLIPKFCELSSAPESRELPPAQESCELLSTANSCELPRESCELPLTLKSCELPPIPKSCESPSAPESCELPSAPESCKLPPAPESSELPPSQIPCELTPAPNTCTLAEAPTLDKKGLPIVQEKKNYKPNNVEHHRVTN
ncbi:paternally-expressed gene 3 protein-like isoform X2 [Bombus pyrosoma]|nr:paternally-expressed gene 3 protein-like isoform X2 [Bombus pyrosoma]XP_043589121.1 paternally-expressed gene 3 protein-like isoform X2 [Bombus pyrosoma]